MRHALAIAVAFLLVFPVAAAGRDEPLSLDEAMSLLDDRPAWQAFPPVDDGYLPRHPAEAALRPLTIVLDPGHGGDAHRPNWKRGPTGMREAAANLRVGLLLARLLRDAGATVILTRDHDRDLSLADRARVAVDADADLFVSLHHNAAGRPEPNYPSVWLHGDPKRLGPELDAARSVARALGRRMRTDIGYTSPLMSDLQMYPSGFGVLRHAVNGGIPSMLLESSFHSNPDEETRLRDARHNLREAYAIYEGLAEWAHEGRPTQTVLLNRDGSSITLTATLDDGLPQNWWGSDRRGPVPFTVGLFQNGKRIPADYDEATRTLTATVAADAGPIAIYHENIFGHRNWPRDIVLDDNPTPPPATRPGNTGPAWADLPNLSTPIFLLDGGATLDGQAALDAIEMPAGSAMTIARLDPAGRAIYAVRWRDTGTVGFYPASTVKLATAHMTLRQVADLGGDFDEWSVAIEEAPPEPVATLLRDMIKDSSNEAFNTLQEVAGFAETQAYMDGLGVEKFTIRRHFTRPHWNHSREASFTNTSGGTVAVPARPAPDLPLNADPDATTSGGGESNWASTDDLVRLLAATFAGDLRETEGFDLLADAMADTNEPFIERGLTNLGDFHVWNKPGWWPGDGAYVDAAYVFDAHTGRHYLVAIHWQGEVGVVGEDDPDAPEMQAARRGIADAVRDAFALIRDGKLRL